MKTAAALLVVGLVTVAVHTDDFNAAVATEGNARELARYPDLPEHLKCPKVDREGRLLRSEIAHQSDGRHWGPIDCHYTED